MAVDSTEVSDLVAGTGARLMAEESIKLSDAKVDRAIVSITEEAYDDMTLSSQETGPRTIPPSPTFSSSPLALDPVASDNRSPFE